MLFWIFKHMLSITTQHMVGSKNSLFQRYLGLSFVDNLFGIVYSSY